MNLGSFAVAEIHWIRTMHCVLEGIRIQNPPHPICLGLPQLSSQDAAHPMHRDLHHREPCLLKAIEKFLQHLKVSIDRGRIRIDSHRQVHSCIVALETFAVK